MKNNTTVLLTLILLTLMLGAGSASGFLGFTLGSMALKGVTTPDGRPVAKFKSNKGNNPEQESTTFLKEEDILKVVKARISDKNRDNKAEKLEDEENIQVNKPQPKDTPEPAEETIQPGFPVVAESEGVIMSVKSVRYSGGDLLLRVNMQNKSGDSVRFLYSFLDIIDDKGRTLSGITEGLPAELPSKSSEFKGTISIPTALLDDVKQISLSLTDYPTQKLKLQLSDIPVEKTN